MTDLESIFTTLFSAPSKVVVDADARYRQIWMEWLQNIRALITARDTAVGGTPLTTEQQKALIEAQLGMAPVMKLDAAVEVAVTMRLASVTQKEGKASLGVGVGAFQVSGSFGMSSQTSQESILQARAVYNMANNSEKSLASYLKDYSIPVTDAASLGKAIAFLGTPAVTPAATTGKTA